MKGKTTNCHMPYRTGNNQSFLRILFFLDYLSNRVSKSRSNNKQEAVLASKLSEKFGMTPE